MLRLLFEKKGNAVWISHLDLMRLFQRAFQRAGLVLTHTQGFNPRPSVSIAMPLSVGVESCCELLDFQLEGESYPLEEIADRLNNALVSGIRVLRVYPAGKKLKELAYLDTRILMEYDGGVSEKDVSILRSLFEKDSLIVSKKSKNGIAEQDIIPMIRSIQFSLTDAHTVTVNARICCQNPSLNPVQLVAAIRYHCPDQAPSFASCSRLEIYDHNNEIFR